MQGLARMPGGQWMVEQYVLPADARKYQLEARLPEGARLTSNVLQGLAIPVDVLFEQRKNRQALRALRQQTQQFRQPIFLVSGGHSRTRKRSVLRTMGGGKTSQATLIPSLPFLRAAFFVFVFCEVLLRNRLLLVPLRDDAGGNGLVDGGDFDFDARWTGDDLHRKGAGGNGQNFPGDFCAGPDKSRLGLRFSP